MLIEKKGGYAPPSNSSMDKYLPSWYIDIKQRLSIKGGDGFSKPSPFAMLTAKNPLEFLT